MSQPHERLDADSYMKSLVDQMDAPSSSSIDSRVDIPENALLESLSGRTTTVQDQYYGRNTHNNDDEDDIFDRIESMRKGRSTNSLGSRAHSVGPFYSSQASQSTSDTASPLVPHFIRKHQAAATRDRVKEYVDVGKFEIQIGEYVVFEIRSLCMLSLCLIGLIVMGKC